MCLMISLDIHQPWIIGGVHVLYVVGYIVISVEFLKYKKPARDNR